LPGAGMQPYFPLGTRRIRFSVAFSTACLEYSKGKYVPADHIGARSR
jgi:hypothetical protein